MAAGDRGVGYDRNTDRNNGTSSKSKVGASDAFQGISSKKHVQNTTKNKSFISVLIVNVSVSALNA